MQIDQKLANYFEYYENISLSKSCKIFIFQYFLDSKLLKKKNKINFVNYWLLLVILRNGNTENFPVKYLALLRISNKNTFLTNQQIINIFFLLF